MKNDQSSPYGRRFFYGYIVVITALLITILNYGSRFSFGVFFKPMLNEFGWSRTLTSGAFTTSMLCQAMGTPILGRLNDKLGPRFVMTFCGFFLGVGFLLMSQLSNVWQLYLIYGMFIGISMGGQFVSLLSTIARWFSKRRGIMTGIVIAGIGIGGFIMAPIANYLISIYDWRISYIIMGSAVLVIGVLAAQFLRRDPAKMGVSPYGANNEEKHGLTAVEEGLFLREAIRTKQFLILLIMFMSAGYCLMTINVHIVPNVTDLGISSVIAANVLAVIGALTALGCIVLGAFADKIGNKQVCIISFIALAVAVFGFAFVKEIWAMYLFAAIFGIGAGGTAPVESTITAELFGMKSHGSIFGIISAGFTIGAAIGPFVTGFLFDITGNYHMAFLVCSGIGVIGLIFSLLVKPIVKSDNRIGT